MKILLFLQKWPGGVGVVVNSLKKEFLKKGHEVICISREDDLKKFSSVKNLFWLKKEYAKIILRENPDIVYTQDWSMALPLIFSNKRTNQKHFCCFHGHQPGKSKAFQKGVGKIMGNKLIVVGDSLKKAYPRASLIYNGIDLNLFKPDKEIKKIKNSVGFVNWKKEEYNYSYIKNACKKEGKIFLVAEGLSQKEMPDFYNSLEIFISLPPKYTGFNMSWLEAMSCGVPKIIGNGFGVGKKIQITQIEDFSSLNEAMKKSEEKDYRKILKNSNKFSWEENAMKLLKLWKNDSIIVNLRTFK